MQHQQRHQIDYPTFMEAGKAGGISPMSAVFPAKDIVTAVKKTDAFKVLFQDNGQSILNDLLNRLALHAGKKSFLVFKQNKYTTVPTEQIAFFYVRHESTMIVCFDHQEYSVNYSLEQLQTLLTEKHFFRVNRQYLVSFFAVKEVEHYFARKLLVNLLVATREKLLVSKEKVSSFFNWMEDR